MTCAQAKEFLSRHAIPHQVRDIWKDASAKLEMQQLGLETVPVLVQGDWHLNIHHVDQLRELFGIADETAPPDYQELAAACERVLRAFEVALQDLPAEHIGTPTPNRGRDMRTMTYNVHAPLAQVVEALVSGHYVYPGELDEERSRRFGTVAELIGFAEDTRERWFARIRDVTPEEAEQPVMTKRGLLTHYQVLDLVARHAAGHLRQTYAFLRQIGIDPCDEMSDAEMAPIAVQHELY